MLLSMFVPSVTFQSTLPTRGSDYIFFISRRPDDISIHAPHEGERQPTTHRRYDADTYFNPRSPRGGATRSCSSTVGGIAEFQSTLPTRGSDAPYCDTCGAKIFQSTLPTRGSDGCAAFCFFALSNFNPRSPRGGATEGGSPRKHKYGISIHAPHEGERLRQGSL